MLNLVTFMLIVFGLIASPMNTLGDYWGMKRACAQSDAELLFQGSPTHYIAQPVTLSATLDLTPLYDRSAPQASSLASALTDLGQSSSQEARARLREEEALSALESQVIIALKRWPNLRLISSKKRRTQLKRGKGQARLIQLSQTFTKNAISAYKEVDLKRAQASLDSALELMFQAHSISISPQTVAQLYLFRGTIAVESHQYLRASLDFQRALLLDPSLRLKPGFDHDEVLRIFEEVLQQLRGLSSLELIQLAEQREWSESSGATLVLMKVKREVFSLLYRRPRQVEVRAKVTRQIPSIRRVNVKGGLVDLVAREQYIWGSDDLASRIASRVWACLPLSRLKPTRGRPPRLQLLGGWQASTSLRSPVSQITHFGATARVVWRALSQLSLHFGGAWSTSSLDPERDLQSALTSWETYLGPQWSLQTKRLWLSLGLMAELSWRSGSSLTRAVGCKYFDLSSTIPPEICNPQRDIREVSPTWRLGPRAELSFGVKLADKLLIGAQVFSSFDLYQSSNHPFGWPLGGAVLIGYSFHSL